MLTDDRTGGPDFRLLDQRIGRLLEDKLRARVGGSGHGGGIDAWQQSVENRLTDLSAQVRDLRIEVREELRAVRSAMASWFRWLIGLLVVIFASLLGTMARGFGWL